MDLIAFRCCRLYSEASGRFTYGRLDDRQGYFIRQGACEI